MKKTHTITIETTDEATADLLCRVAKAMPQVDRVAWQTGFGIDAAEGPTTPPTDPGGPDDAKPTIVETIRIDVDDSAVDAACRRIDAATRALKDAAAAIAHA